MSKDTDFRESDEETTKQIMTKICATKTKPCGRGKPIS